MTGRPRAAPETAAAPPPTVTGTAATPPARGRLVGPAIVLLLLVALLAGIARSVLVGDGGRTLAVPPPGEVVASFVAGDPVFVVHDEDGDLRVLDAVDAYLPDDPMVLVFCADSDTFEDLRFGSRYTRRGGWMGGPSPVGMASYEVVERRDEQVVIGERGDPPAREDADRGEVVIPPSCIARLNGWDGGEPDPSAVDDLVLHDGPASEDDVRRYPAAGLAEHLEGLARSGEPDAPADP